MARLRGEELTRLYPQPKSREELRQAQQARMAARRPRFVPLKLALWSTIAAVGIYGTFLVVTQLMSGSLSSPGMVISGVSFSLLISLAMAGLIVYIVSLMRNVLERVVARPAITYGAQIVAVGGGCATYQFMVIAGLTDWVAVVCASACIFVLVLILTSVTTARIDS